MKKRLPRLEETKITLTSRVKAGLLGWLTKSSGTSQRKGVRSDAAQKMRMGQQLAAMGRFGQPLVVGYK